MFMSLACGIFFSKHFKLSIDFLIVNFQFYDCTLVTHLGKNMRNNKDLYLFQVICKCKVFWDISF